MVKTQRVKKLIIITAKNLVKTGVWEIRAMIDHLKGELSKARRSIRNPEDKFIEFGGNRFEFGREK